MPSRFVVRAIVALCLTIPVCLVNMPAQAQELFLTSGSYTANDATYQNGQIYTGLDADSNSSDPNTGQPYVATLNVVTGGNVLIAEGYSTSTVNISGGNVTFANGFETSTVNIRGGAINTATGYDNSTVNIRGGAINTAKGLNTSTVNIYGGNITDIFGSADSVFNIYGGTIGQNTIRLSDNSTLKLFGTNLSFSSAGTGSDGNGSFTDYVLSGTLQGGQSISGVHLHDYNGGFSVNPNGPNNNLIFSSAAPEPGTLVLLAVGVIGLVVRRRKA